ncbi:MAG: 50S ribosomal protein L22 [Candidatus Dadabacteria bacterium]|nr:50S ribosomal protein L22 [Candidatus Dadabacteria bacterium]
MISKATHKHVHTSTKKVGLVLSLIRGKRVENAFAVLSAMNKRNAPVVAKILKSAVANAFEKGYSDTDTIFIKEAYATPGPTLKRFRPRAMGRASMIRKRTSHITLVLEHTEV